MSDQFSVAIENDRVLGAIKSTLLADYPYLLFLTDSDRFTLYFEDEYLEAIGATFNST